MRIKSQLSAFSILILLSFFIVPLTPSHVAAQVDEQEKAQKELEKRKELEHQTLALVDFCAASNKLRIRTHSECAG